MVTAGANQRAEPYLSDKCQWSVVLVIGQVQPAGDDFEFEKCALQRQKNQLYQAWADNLFFGDKILDPRFPLAEKNSTIRFFEILLKSKLCCEIGEYQSGKHHNNSVK